MTHFFKTGESEAGYRSRMAPSLAETVPGLIRASVRCADVRAPIDYALLRPRGNADVLPLLYVLHGGGSSRDYLQRVAPVLERCWAEQSLPQLVAVTPSAGQSAYLNSYDGADRWEDALTGSFLQHLRDTCGVSSERRLTLTCGPSLGGTGSLRLAFKHPHLFGGAAALAPGIQPVVAFSEIDPEDLFWKAIESQGHFYGSPVDADFWRRNHPTAIAADAPDRLRDADLAIYLECGDEDSFGMQRGAERLHRVLFDHHIPHEYRLVRGADHVGASFPERFRDALGFLAKVIAPPPPDPVVSAFRERVAELKRTANRVPTAPVGSI